MRWFSFRHYQQAKTSPHADLLHLRTEISSLGALVLGVLLFWSSYRFASLGLDEAARLWRGETFLQRVANPRSPEDIAQGRLRASVSIAAGTGEAPPRLCRVVQSERGAIFWEGTFRENARFRLRNGQLFDFSSERVLWNTSRTRPSEEKGALWRKEFGLSSEGQVSEVCFREGDTLFVEACMGEDRVLRSCGEEETHFTEGGAWLISELAQESSLSLAWLSFWGLAALCLLFGGWLIWRQHPLVGALAPRLGLELRKSRWERGLPWFAVLAYVAFVALCFLYYAPLPMGILLSLLGYWVALLVGALGLVLAVQFAFRWRILRALLASLRTDPAPLSQLQNTGQAATVEARVASQAPTEAGPLSGEARAWWWLLGTSIARRYKSIDYQRFSSCSRAGLVPLEDKAGEGWLDLQTAQINTRTLHQTMSRRELLAEPRDERWQVQRFHGQQAILEESFLLPGESLLLFGFVTRLVPSSAEGGAYRGASSAPVLGGSPEHPLVVCAGTRRELLRGLRLYGLGFALLCSLSFALVLSSVAACLWFWM
jgi:hypothetical protein